jgi:hypothetical protein
MRDVFNFQPGLVALRIVVGEAHQLGFILIEKAADGAKDLRLIEKLLGRGGTAAFFNPSFVEFIQIRRPVVNRDRRRRRWILGFSLDANVEALEPAPFQVLANATKCIGIVNLPHP